MSFDEKGTWILAVLAVVVPGAYGVAILAQARNTQLAQIDYVPMMLTAIGVTIVLAIVAHILVAIGSPKEADKRDERDTSIDRHGELVGSYVLYVGVLVALGLVMARVEYFWIALRYSWHSSCRA
ncbi:MAG: hypothetical protein H0T59_11105 [Chloroflexi bacterium]|nr:hypothetical protein [Chloroflexota bacterium]